MPRVLQEVASSETLKFKPDDKPSQWLLNESPPPHAEMPIPVNKRAAAIDKNVVLV